MAIYVAVFASLIGLYLIYRLFLLTLIKIFGRLCKNIKKQYLEVENYESDFYSCVNVSSLQVILKDSREQLKQLQIMFRQGIF